MKELNAADTRGGETNKARIKYVFFNKWTQDRERNVSKLKKKRLLLKLHISHHREKIPVSV